MVAAEPQDPSLEKQKQEIKAKMEALDRVVAAISGVEDPEVAQTLAAKVAARAALKDQLRDLKLQEVQVQLATAERDKACRAVGELRSDIKAIGVLLQANRSKLSVAEG